MNSRFQLQFLNLSFCIVLKIQNLAKMAAICVDKNELLTIIETPKLTRFTPQVPILDRLRLLR